MWSRLCLQAGGRLPRPGSPAHRSLARCMAARWPATGKATPGHVRYLSTGVEAPSSSTPEDAVEVNPYLLKYREKIQKRLEESKGQLEVKDPEAEIKKYFHIPEGLDEADEEMVKGWAKLYEKMQQQEAKEGSGGSHADNEQKVFNARRLGDIIDMEKFRALPATLVAQLWDAHFSSQADSRFIHAVLGSESYFELANKLDACPMFLFALPREGGHEMFLSQYSRHQVFFTTLLSYQSHGENATPVLTLTNYIDLMKDKGLILTLAEYDDNMLKAEDARTLLNKLQEYISDPVKYELVKSFNLAPDKFDYNVLIQ